MSPSPNSDLRERGFTLVEVVIAISILVVGMLSAALLSARMMSAGRQSKFMSLAAMLASEKLEDLNRWDSDDPHVAVTSGNVAGSLTADVNQDVTVEATTTSVNYYDEISYAATGGAISETVSGLGSGAIVYTTTTHTPDGTVTAMTSSTPPNAPTFRRRWVIEKDSPASGVRRVTVLVSLLDASVQPPVSFQMSMVRP